MMVKEAVTDQGGTIAVESVLGKGSTFTVCLPLAESAATEPAALDQLGDSRQPLRVMVVDDDPAILEVSKVMLAHLGHRATCLNDPQQALTRDLSSIDLLITDYRMNGTSGVELVRQLRDYEGPVLLMSGLYDDQDDLPPGIDGRINKPFKLETLRAAIESVTAVSEQVS